MRFMIVAHADAGIIHQKLYDNYVFHTALVCEIVCMYNN